MKNAYTISSIARQFCKVAEKIDSLVFGTGTTQPGEGNESGGGECGCTTDIASDEEVDAMLNGVFGR